MREPRERLRDILEAIDSIDRYVERGREAFEQDELIQSWVVRHLQTIGEAVRLLPEDVRSVAEEVPWKKIVGMRHFLVHVYFAVDTDKVWQTAVADLPLLKTAVTSLLATLDGEHPES